MNVHLAHRKSNYDGHEILRLKDAYQKAIKNNKEFSEVRKIYERLKASLHNQEPANRKIYS